MTKKELEAFYISLSPEKFNSFIHEIKNSRNNSEISTLDLQSLVGRLIREDIEECRRIGMKASGMTAEENSLLTFRAKTAALQILLLIESRSYTQLSETCVLFLEYSSYLVKSSYDFSGTVLKALSYKLKDAGFSYSTLENATSADMIAYQFCSKARFDTRDPLKAFSYSGSGHASISEGMLRLSSCQKTETATKCLETDNGRISIETRNSRDERIKMSDSEDAIRLSDFFKTFSATQNAVGRMPKYKNEELKEGNKYTVQIENKEEKGEIIPYCHVLGYDDENAGIIEDEELIKGIYASDIFPFLYDDDCIMDAVLLEKGETPVFSIRDAYASFARKSADQDYRSNAVFEAKLINRFKGITEDKDRLIWMTPGGYGALLRDNGQYKEGDTDTFSVLGVQNIYSDTYINLDEAVVGPETKVVRFPANEDVLYSKFTMSREKAETELAEREKALDDSSSSGPVLSLGRILARMRYASSIEKYKALLTSAALSNLCGDEKNRIYALSRAEYLKHCLAVAQKTEVRSIAEDIELTEKERSMIHVLSSINHLDDVSLIAELLKGCPDGSKEREIASLMMAHSISLSQPDDVKYDIEQMRKKICTILNVQDQYSSDSGRGGGKYGLGELDNVEFKSSYVMRNDGKGADLDYQGRGQVFEAVCGMLNKDGGSVYIGVNNYGDPYTGPSYGLNGDLEWFRNNFDTIKITKSHAMGHPVPMPKDLDTYCLFLNDERDLYFKPTLKDYINISPTEDQDAIRITVKPSQFEIAVLYRDKTWKDGQAYVRDGQETAPMTRVQQEQRLMKLRSVGKVEQFILTLTEAIDRQLKVILKNYSSSNSNERKDRFVVPINLVYNNENLWAYDLVTRECREFRLARVADIEVLDEKYPHAYPAGQADVFRWINPKVNYHVKLKLKVSAYNTLIEDFSNAKNLPSTELYQTSPERWILDTCLHGWGAVVRFYIGSCGGSKKEIEILDTEDSEALKAEILKYKEAITF